jgi:DeoR/GlpR family transcriptional regulator of sugar metabolism
MGPLAIVTMQGIRVRKAILGAGGIVADGIYNSNLLLVETQRQMMACGQEVVIAADSTKFGRLALARLCGLGEVHRVVTDPGLPEEYRGILEAAGVAIHLAPLGEAGNLNGSSISEPLRTVTMRTEA